MKPMTSLLWARAFFIVLLGALDSVVISHADGAQPVNVVAWGDNGYGATDVPADLTNTVSVAAASAFNVALQADGTLREWGGNGYSAPPGLDNVKAVAYRFSLGLALLSNGTVTAWGANYMGGNDVPSGLGDVIAIAAGDYHALALKSDGTVVGWGGQDGAGVVPPGLSNVVAISAGGPGHSLALRSDGTVAAWGWNRLGQIDVPPGLSNVVAISAGAYHSTALRGDGTVVVWGGQGDWIQPPPGLTGVVAISAGSWHNLALKSDGTVIAWGSNSRGQLNVPAGFKDVLAVVGGHMHSVVLTTDMSPLIYQHPQSQTILAGGTIQLSVNAKGPGTLGYQWFKDSAPLPGATASILQVGNVDFTNAGTYTVTVTNFGGAITSAPAVVTVIGLTTGGALVNLDGPDPGVADVVAVDACSTHGLAIKPDGTVVGWGDSPAAIVPPGLSNVIDVAVEGHYSLALRADGQVVGWGSASSSAVPLDVTNVIAVGAAERFGLAVRSDGTVRRWGSGSAVPAIVTNAVAVDGGWEMAAALRNDGTVVTWGLFNPNGSLSLSNIAAISLGRGYLLGLRNDGTVVGSGVPAGLANVIAIAAGGDSYGLALRQNGSVVGWGGAPVTAGLTNVTYINANGGGLVITRWPAITRHPRDVTAQIGDAVTMTATVKGVGPFLYQWRKDGIDIPGATAPVLQFNSAQEQDAGAYTIVASNSSGPVESLPGILMFFGEPVLTTQPKSQSVFVGAKVRFAVAAVGANPLHYQWFRNGVAISGGVGSSLDLPSVQSGDAGSYYAVVSNHLAQVASSTVTLDVAAAPVWQLSAPGTVVSLGGPTLPPNLTNAIAVSAGTAHGLALLADHTVAAWGRVYFQEAVVPEGLSNVVAIAAGDNHSLALKADGTVVSWGGSTAAVPPELYGIVGIAAGLRHSLALRVNGTVVSWGGSSFTQPPATLANVIAVDAGSESGVALRSDGTVVRWGPPGGAYTTGLSNIAAVSLCRNNFIALSANGTIATPGAPSGLSNVVAIAAGADAGLIGRGVALKHDGTIATWGGITAPSDLSEVSAISAGGFALLITTNPPIPTILVNSEAGEIVITSPVSVPNYFLEVASGFSAPFTPVAAFTNSFVFTNQENPGFRLPIDGECRIFRLRKR